MADRRAALFSIDPKFAEAILSGEKRYEFRKVRPKLAQGDLVFLYSSSPQMEVVGTFRCGETIEAAPRTLWRRFGKFSGTSRAHLLRYLANKDAGYAIEVRTPRRLRRRIPLRDLRSCIPGFHPPQSFRYVEAGTALAKALGLGRRR